ncbi:MAG: hypothetical protein SGI86_12490 [Deltaproteobacteria bacterium]|nr:hypothetical protein [Deltaproteobacteria bacterium]
MNRSVPKLPTIVAASIFGWGIAANAQPLPPSAEASEHRLSTVVAVAGDCPQSSLVWELLASALAPEVVAWTMRDDSQQAAKASLPAVRVEDQGDAVLVFVAGKPPRRFHDPARLCKERANLVAAHVAFVLYELTPVPDSPPAPALPKPIAAVAPSHTFPLVVALSATAQWPLGARVRPGADLFVAVPLSATAWYGELGIAAQWPTNQDRSGTLFRETRGQLRLGVGRYLFASRLLISTTLTLVADWLSVQPPDVLPLGRADSGINLGVAGDLRVTLNRPSRFVPFFGLSGRLLPSPPRLLIEPAGRIATEALFLGFHVGLWVNL